MRVIFLPAARHDLLALSDYIKDDLQNPIAARNIVEKILHLTRNLVDFPEVSASLKSLDKRFRDYRYLLADNYLIIYRVAQKDVQIVRILYARSDYIHLLQG